MFSSPIHPITHYLFLFLSLRGLLLRGPLLRGLLLRGLLLRGLLLRGLLLRRFLPYRCFFLNCHLFHHLSIPMTWGNLNLKLAYQHYFIS